ncbi:MAG: hypothetical protein ACTS7I_02645, partial [Candidatus Hodgkinia cicadicola]
NPTPKPKIEWDFACSPDNMAEFHGSTATIFVCSGSERLSREVLLGRVLLAGLTLPCVWRVTV